MARTARTSSIRRRRLRHVQVILNALTLSASSVAENSASGVVVGTVLGKTAGSTLSLFNNDGGRFVLNGSNQIVTGLVNIDFEASPTRSITIRENLPSAVTPTVDTVLTISVTDVVENFAPNDITLTGGSLTIAEDAELGTLIGTLGGTDPDVGDTLTFAILTDTDNKFLIVGSSLVLAAPLDFETKTSHNVTIRATDIGGLTYDETFTITVTNVTETAPTSPLPTTGTTVSDGSFSVAPTVTSANGKIKIAGKKASGSTGKFIYDIGVPKASFKYTMKVDPDWSLLDQKGILAALGFGFKSGNNFHLATFKGDGTQQLTLNGQNLTLNGQNLALNAFNAHKVFGTNFSATTGQTDTNVGRVQAGSQDGPNWMQLEVSDDGSTYTLRSSLDGVNWFDEIVSAAPSPLSSATGATSFGVAIYLDSADAGPFSVAISLWTSLGPFSLNPLDTSSGITLSNNNLTATKNTAGTANVATRAISSRNSGKYVFEARVDADSDGLNWFAGIANPQHTLSSYIGQTANSIGLYKANSGGIRINKGGFDVGPSTTYQLLAGEWVMIGVDLDNRLITVNPGNRGWTTPVSFSDLTGPFHPALSLYSALNDAATINFGATAFQTALLAGHASWDGSQTVVSFMRTTQIYAEVPYKQAPTLRTTQIFAEVPYKQTPSLRVTQVIAEVVYKP